MIDTSVPELRKLIYDQLRLGLVRDPETATLRDWWLSTSQAAKVIIIERLIATQKEHYRKNVKRVYYFSLEFLMGRLFSNSLLSAGIFSQAQQAVSEMGLSLDSLREEEYDMGLGSGGLGRLAACFMDSLSTMDLPAVGYGIYYQFGLFKQEFHNGYQVELPDNWICFGSPWKIKRPEYATEVHLYGHVEDVFDGYGNCAQKWVDTKKILGTPHDIPVPGFGTNTVNYLRLWASCAEKSFDFEAFDRGEYDRAVLEKNSSEIITKVLYPNDKTERGRELRFIQQYFFVSCSLQDILRRFRKNNDNWEYLPDKVAIQLNDTHPAIAIVELMRIFLDLYAMPWEQAWSIVTRVFAYTNHTLLPEGLEKWNVTTFATILPRHLQIIYEINSKLLEQVEKKWPKDTGKKLALSLIEEGKERMVRMAHLCVVGSHSVNGVAAMHTQLLKKDLFHEFHALYPSKINNKTNGITPRRWLLGCNPRLSVLITSKIGDGWIKNLSQLCALEDHMEDPDFQRDFMEAKLANKTLLARLIQQECGITIDPNALFDVQIKRLHEYKRQHLNLLHILALYRRLLQNPDLDIIPRVFIFAAKATPGYDMAKCIIKAINSVGSIINRDSRIGGKLKVAFLPNYRVSLAQRIVPAADLSEQISTAGKEASGTSNMKMALNGALTIGTLDGANVEICEEVGEENIFLFGLRVDEVAALLREGYCPEECYHSDEELHAVIDWLGSDYFTPFDPPGALEPLRENLIHQDPFLALADFRSYSNCQQRVEATFRDKSLWARMAILNTARVGKFSSDRAVSEYASEIWKLDPIPVLM
ncbi:MAG: glycogen/starch/alpha-glucan phosphorylase [Candidatus Xiphinematobacter sp.]|nr:MAG: glycogen/starch/alpha-glucan phosphorylase [Candidatus Xiphinematobacter sp.]